MNVLVLGQSAKPGSWTVRGQQLGAALGARVTSAPSPADWIWADLAVIVKRSEARFGPAARAAGVPIVWDALDFWAQPLDNSRDEASARAMLAAHLAAIRPGLTIGATEAQAQAAGGVYLPHHSRPGLEPAPIRDRVATVAYEGNAAYLGVWMERVSRACAVRGWRFVINPSDLRDADLLVALRDGPWDGWACREWKSGVKLVNAIAAGRPMIAQRSAAWREINPPGSAVVDAADLETAFDSWSPYQARAWALGECRVKAPAYRLETVAADYRAMLSEVRCAA